jgi:hypothetical protein
MTTRQQPGALLVVIKRIITDGAKQTLQLCLHKHRPRIESAPKSCKNSNTSCSRLLIIDNPKFNYLESLHSAAATAFLLDLMKNQVIERDSTAVYSVAGVQ